MLNAKTIKVLIVDDSLLFREILSRGLSSDRDIEVVATAKDAFDARDKIIEFEPDVMTCDVEMPKMNGIEFIRRLLPQYSIPVIVVSTIDGIVFDALNAGAVDFVAKPNLQSTQNVETFLYDLIMKVKVASQAKIVTKKETKEANGLSNNVYLTSNKLIAIGASTGGTEAIQRILMTLTKQTPGIVIVQHIPPVFSRMFADRLNTTTNLQVKEAKSGDYVTAGHVFIAPGDQHMKIKAIGDRYRIDCFTGEKVNGHCPSVDVLFESVAKEAKEKGIGIILTGMGNDGAKGLLSMRKNGARTIGQDEYSSVVYGMPKTAYNIGAVEKQTSLDDIAKTIYSVL